MSLHVKIKKRLKKFELNVEFSLKSENLGVLGPSGSGKSMTLKCIAGIMTPDEGKIILNSRVLYDSEKGINLRPQDRNVGYLFQNFALFPHMTVEENIGIALKMDRTSKNTTVDEMMRKFHLSDLAKLRPHQISGGQQQRVALARSLITQPDIMLLDEPFSALDAHLRDHMQKEVMEYLSDYKGDVLMVSHSRDEIFRMCESLMIMDQGHTFVFGETKAIFGNPKYKEAALLTGCKNFSRCEIRDRETIDLLDWGISFKTSGLVQNSIKYVGVRAHEFELAEPTERNAPNTFPARIVKTVEDVFEYTHYLNFNSSAEIVFKVNKEKWHSWPFKDDLYLAISQSVILLLN